MTSIRVCPLNGILEIVYLPWFHAVVSRVRPFDSVATPLMHSQSFGLGMVFDISSIDWDRLSVLVFGFLLGDPIGDMT